MRIATFFLLVASATAFVPQRSFRTVPTQLTDSDDPVAELCDNVVSKTETVLGKIDDLVLNRAMRLVNHVPALFTLKQLGAAAGGSVRFGIDSAASAFPAVAAPAMLAVPTWTNNIWRIICAAQIASVAKSVLASDDDELSQNDISALAAANFAAREATTSGSLGWMALTSIISGYSARNSESDDGSITIHNASMQLMSSYTAIATILGATNALPQIVPLLEGKAVVLSGLGLAGYYMASTRNGNSTTKKVVNAVVMGGILAGKVAGGALALTRANLLQVGTLITVATAYVAYGSIMNAKDALA